MQYFESLKLLLNAGCWL